MCLYYTETVKIREIAAYGNFKIQKYVRIKRAKGKRVKERKRKSKDKRYCRTAGVQVPGLRTGTAAYTVHSTT